MRFSTGRITSFKFEFGLPINLKILKSCSTSDSPSNRALSQTNSANIHPIAHMSTSYLVIDFLKSISGAQYQSHQASLPDHSHSFGSSGV